MLADQLQHADAWAPVDVVASALHAHVAAAAVGAARALSLALPSCSRSAVPDVSRGAGAEAGLSAGLRAGGECGDPLAVPVTDEDFAEHVASRVGQGQQAFVLLGIERIQYARMACVEDRDLPHLDVAPRPAREWRPIDGRRDAPGVRCERIGAIIHGFMHLERK